MEDFVQKKLIESNYSDEVWESVQPDRAAIENMRREERALMDSYLDEIDVGEGSTRSVAHGQSVYPVHLKMQNPFEYDFQGGDRVESFAALLDKARANGHDSAIFRNVRDPLHNNVHVVFEPNQIRSVNADFNPEYKDSSNLLAGIAGVMPYAGATAAALAGATGSQDAEAGPLQTLGRAAPYLTSAALGGAAALQSGDAEAGIITRGGRRLIEAWHGSPHSFDKFDISKIGTGEGAQAYGHGLYFADAPETAKEYRDVLAQKQGRHSTAYTVDGAVLERGHPDYQAADMASIIRQYRSDLEAEPGGIKDWLKREIGARGIQDKGVFKRTLALAEQPIDAQRKAGSLYRTEIDVDPDTLLDWDKPLSEQPDNIKAAWGNFVSNNPAYADPAKVGGQFANPTGEQFYSAIFEESPGMGMPARAQVTETLKAQGIPGIRYLDQMSRGDVAEPTYNYVMFDDKPISIVERGNATPALLEATAVGTGAGMYAASDAEAGPLDALGRAAPYLATGALGAAMMTPQDTQAYNDYIRDEMEARTAADRFTQMRGSKAGYWEARRQELLDMVSGLGALAGEVADVALRSPTNQAIYGIASMNSDKIWHDADMPLRSLLAGGGVIRDAAQWQNLQAIGQNAQQIINTPSEQTTYGVGGAVTDALSPYTTPEAAAAAGALVHGGIQIASPF